MKLKTETENTLIEPLDSDNIMAQLDQHGAVVFGNFFNSSRVQYFNISRVQEFLLL